MIVVSMRTHQLKPESSAYVWDQIWAGDIYAWPAERLQRAQRRANAFSLERFITPNAAILDIGCGSGELLGILEESSRLMIGLDRSTTALNLARGRSAAHAHFVAGLAEALPLPNDSFDNIIAFGILEHVQDYQRLISEIYRVMKPGATAFISSSNAWSLLQLKNCLLSVLGKYRYGFQKNWTAFDLEALLQERFQIERKFVLQADSDMRLIAILDGMVARFVSNWGRYICVVVSKRDG